MTFPIDARLQVRKYYLDRYQVTKPVNQEWTAGTAMPELVDMVIQGRFTQGARILEVGCGTGAEAVFLAVQGFNVSAIDISPDAIEQAKLLANFYGVNVDWRVGDVLSMPLESEQFDIVTDRGCFHCLRPDERPTFAQEISRLLKPKGLYILRCI